MKNLFINYANPSDKVLSIKSLLFLLIFILPTIVFGQTTLCSTYGGNTPDYTWSGLSLSSSSLSSSYTSKVIVLTSDLNINSNLTLTGCQLKINSGVKITVQSGYTLSFSSCQIFSCGSYRWDGIEVNTGGILIMIGSALEDADIAVKGYSMARVVLRNNNFNRNTIAVANQIFENFTLAFTGNTVDCTSALLWPESDHIPLNWSLYGIRFLYAVMTVGVDNNSFINDFKNMNTGIYSLYSYVIIHGCYFHDMIHTNEITNGYNGHGIPSNSYVPDQAYSGSGIWQLGGRINIDGPRGTGTNRTFRNNLKDGITVRGGGILNCTNARFYLNQEYGISVSENSTPAQIKIKNCSFKTNASYGIGGIYLQRSSGKPGLEPNNTISNDTFNIEHTTGTLGSGVYSAIYITGINNGKDYFNIDHNEINISGAPDVHGIYYEAVQGSDFNRILDNIITPDNTTVSWGILMYSSSGAGLNNMVYRNIIHAASTANGEDMYCAIHNESVPAIHYCKNDLVGCYNGFHSIGMNTNTDFVTNILGDNNIGIALEAGTKLGTQKCKANTFHLPVSDYHFYAASAGDLTAIAEGHFYINPTIAAEDPNAKIYGTNWFTTNNICEDSIPPSTCKVYDYTHKITPDISDFDRTVAKGDYDGSGGDSYLFEAQIQLYNRFVDHYAIYSTFDTLNDFMDYNATTIIGILSEVDNDIAIGLVMPTPITSANTYSNSALTTRLGQLNGLDSLINVAPTSTAGYWASRDTLMDTISIHTTNLASQFSDFVDNRDDILGDALDLINTLTPLTTYEYNAIVTRRIHLESILFQDDTLTSEQIDTLLEIAVQCPADGGHGVAYAQALLPLNISYERWNLDEQCEEEKPSKVTNLTSDAEINLYPNPSSGQVSIISKNFIKTLYIYSSDGKLIKFEDDINNSNYEFILQEIGSYFLKIQDINGDLHTKKFIIK